MMIIVVKGECDMGFVISMQGGMASGKTTLARELEASLKDVIVSYEDITEAIKEVKSRGLDKSLMEDYLEIQRIFIRHEIKRYDRLINSGKNVIIDMGPDQIEFYTINYPKSIGEKWDVELLLKDELKALRECTLDMIIYLDADIETLIDRKESDNTRSRGFFKHYIDNLHNRKRDWFIDRNDTVFIDTTKRDIDLLVKDVVNRIEDII